jgi:hypothetical protein
MTLNADMIGNAKRGLDRRRTNSGHAKQFRNISKAPMVFGSRFRNFLTLIGGGTSVLPASLNWLEGPAHSRCSLGSLCLCGIAEQGRSCSNYFEFVSQLTSGFEPLFFYRCSKAALMTEQGRRLGHTVRGSSSASD